MPAAANKDDWVLVDRFKRQLSSAKAGKLKAMYDVGKLYERGRGTNIDLKLADSFPLIESDRGQLQQIFLNLINNAIEAIDKDGMVTVATSLRTYDTIQVDVTDNGKGIPHEIMSHIFEPFFTTKDGEKKGTGLGLFITYGLIKKLGGNISVRSRIGIGTTFSVIMPTKIKMSRSKNNV